MRDVSGRLLAPPLLQLLAAVLLMTSASTGGVAHASGFAPAPGSVWGKISFIQWSADEVYTGPFDRNPAEGRELGDPRPFDASTGGELSSLSAQADVIVSPIELLSVGVSFPFFQQVEFKDNLTRSVTSGTGDVRGFVGVQLPTPVGSEVGTSLRLHTKIPTTTLPADVEFIPLSEGQLDLAIEHETTYAPISALHLTLRTLLRKRLEFDDPDSERVLKPGDEWEVGANVGGAPIDGLWLKAGYEGLWSTGFEDRTGGGAVSLRDRKIVHSALVAAYVSFGRWIHPVIDQLALDAWAMVPFAGEDYPIGVSFGAGLAYGYDW